MAQATAAKQQAEVQAQEAHIETKNPQKGTENTQEEGLLPGEVDPERFFIRMYVTNCGLATEDDFYGSLAAFECEQAHEDNSVHEIILRGEATKLWLGLQRLERYEKAIVLNQRPTAFARLMRKEMISSTELGQSTYEQLVGELDDSEALEGEALLEVLPSLAVIHRQKTSDRKALLKILKELEARRARHALKEKHAKNSTPATGAA
jgi:hypothetical protein